MKLASLLLSFHQASRAVLIDQLRGIPGVIVHAELPGPKLVVTVEDGPDHELVQSLMQAQGLTGVVCATLTYEYCDEAPPSLERAQ
jgi:nitrate reductase NapAB chaperone NapD